MFTHNIAAPVTKLNPNHDSLIVVHSSAEKSKDGSRYF
jgi:hypothetical protein